MGNTEKNVTVLLKHFTHREFEKFLYKLVYLEENVICHYVWNFILRFVYDVLTPLLTKGKYKIMDSAWPTQSCYL